MHIKGVTVENFSSMDWTYVIHNLEFSIHSNKNKKILETEVLILRKIYLVLASKGNIYKLTS